MATSKTKGTVKTPRTKKSEVIVPEAVQNNFVKQSRVIAAIEAYLHKRTVECGRRYTVQEMASDMGLDTPSNIIAIRNGLRYMPRMDQDFVRALAKILNVSVVTLYQMAEFILPEDLYYDDDLLVRANQTYSKMQGDLASQDVVPASEEWESWPDSAKIHFAILYEHHNQRVMTLLSKVPEAKPVSRKK